MYIICESSLPEQKSMGKVSTHKSSFCSKMKTNARTKLSGKGMSIRIEKECDRFGNKVK
jgi:hypothetical protein